MDLNFIGEIGTFLHFVILESGFALEEHSGICEHYQVQISETRHLFTRKPVHLRDGWDEFCHHHVHITIHVILDSKRITPFILEVQKERKLCLMRNG